MCKYCKCYCHPKAGLLCFNHCLILQLHEEKKIYIAAIFGLSLPEREFCPNSQQLDSFKNRNPAVLLPIIYLLKSGKMFAKTIFNRYLYLFNPFSHLLYRMCRTFSTRFLIYCTGCAVLTLGYIYS